MPEKDPWKREKKIEDEMGKIERDIEFLREKLLEKHPSHFSNRDIINTFFGSLIIGLTFIMKGAVVATAKQLSRQHLLLIVISTIAILTCEIYWIGYSRVSRRERKKRGFFQFWAKRITALYGIALIVSVYLVYIFGVNQFFITQQGVFNIVILMSMPCAVGAAIPHLLKKY